MKTPKLLRIRLDGTNENPKITTRKSYLALIEDANDTGKSFYAGKFSKEWWGWHFDGWFDCGISLDSIVTLWEIKRK